VVGIETESSTAARPRARPPMRPITTFRHPPACA